MDITQEQVNDNHLKLLVNVKPEDYVGKVDEEIKSLSRKITMNGFRPGKVPMGVAKKFYGNSVLADHLDKMLNNSVLTYIKEHDLKVLGQPIPFEVKSQQIDIQRPDSYDFGFELGLIPAFEVPPLEQKIFEKKILSVTDEMVQEEINRLQSRYGERSYPDTAGESDILHGEWKELDENAGLKENGIASTSSFSLTVIKDDVSKQLLQGLKKNESTDLNIKTAFGNDMEMIIHNILKTDHHAADQMNDRFRFTLQNITHIEKANLDQELFNKAYGEGQINSEDELKERIRTDIANEYKKYTLAKLDHEIQEYLINETVMNLPADFLRKLINANKEKDAADIDDAQMTKYLQQVKWDLIHDKIVREKNISVTREELSEKAQKDIVNYYGGSAAFQNDDDALNRLSASLLNDEKYAARIRDEVLNDKIFELLRAGILAEEKVVDQHEFFHH